MIEKISHELFASTIASSLLERFQIYIKKNKDKKNSNLQCSKSSAQIVKISGPIPDIICSSWSLYWPLCKSPLAPLCEESFLSNFFVVFLDCIPAKQQLIPLGCHLKAFNIVVTWVLCFFEDNWKEKPNVKIQSQSTSDWWAVYLSDFRYHMLQCNSKAVSFQVKCWPDLLMTIISGKKSY